MNLVRADLSEISLRGADLTGSNLRMADLNRADLREATLTSAHLSGASINEAQLVGANLVEASMIGVTLKGADLSRADLSGADLTGANLDDARLVGTYLVGAFLNEASLSAADISGGYVRMAQLAGSNLAGAQLDNADLSQADLSGVRLDHARLLGANLSGALLKESHLVGCDLRGANLAGADLSGCNLTGAKLHGSKFEGVKLDDAWAEWVDLSDDGSGIRRASIEEALVDILGKPLAEVLIEGPVREDAWAELIRHMAEFQVNHPAYSDVKMRAIQQGHSSSVMYVEADNELSLAAYLADMADIMGRGSVELFQKLASVVPSNASAGACEAQVQEEAASAAYAAEAIGSAQQVAVIETASPAGSGSGPLSFRRAPALEESGFWQAEKAVAILTGDRKVWLESSSNSNLTLRPPHGVVSGIDLVRGRFVAETALAVYNTAASLDEPE